MSSLADWLDTNGLTALGQPLDDLGVEELHDLELLDPEDVTQLKTCLKKVQVMVLHPILFGLITRPGPAGVNCV